MSVFGQAWNKLQLYVHKQTYDPEAEKFIKKQKELEATEKQKAATERDTKKRLESEKKLKDAADAKKKAEDAAKAKEQESEAERNKFDVWRLLGRVMSTTIGMITTFIIFALAIWGSSLATNLNVYRDWPYRLLYAIYGLVFFFIVIPYAMLYRWFWKGKKPRYYALIPLIPYHIDHPLAAFLFSWLSFKPDAEMNDLKEWLH